MAIDEPAARSAAHEHREGLVVRACARVPAGQVAAGRVGVDVVRKPGVMDPVQASALRGTRELGGPVTAVRTGKR